ncbi:MAG: DUF2214 family protein [Pseudomonadota bacterium]|nr:DUF2214 family protein [Pseudomonadota bacterium]
MLLRGNGAARHLRANAFQRVGQAPALEPRKLRRIRSLIHFELALLMVLILCAALMAKGIGVRG